VDEERSERDQEQPMGSRPGRDREQEAALVTGAFTGAGGGVGHGSRRQRQAATADLVAADRSGQTNVPDGPGS
jgi:hypothetical protein